jgi:hypothetical protein
MNAGHESRFQNEWWSCPMWLQRSWFAGFLVFVALLRSSNPVWAQGDEQPVCQLPELRLELLQRMEADQKIRKEVNRRLANGENLVAVSTKLGNRMARVDRKNWTWLSRQVRKHGWLGKSLVGEDGARAAWLLVQHADANPKFQRTCLDKMNQLADGEVGAADVAYLTDRVLLAEGKKQRYGTQMRGILRAGKQGLEPLPCESPEQLDALRAEVGLPPMSEYMSHFQNTSAAN